jgi:hypothetical protein
VKRRRPHDRLSVASQEAKLPVKVSAMRTSMLLLGKIEKHQRGEFRDHTAEPKKDILRLLTFAAS